MNMKSITIAIPALSFRNPIVVEQEEQNPTPKVLENKANDSARKEAEKWGKDVDLNKVKSVLNLSGKDRMIRTGGVEKTLSHEGNITLVKDEERVGWVELDPAPTAIVKTTLKLSETLPTPEVGKLIVLSEEVARFVWDTTNRRDIVYTNEGVIVTRG